MPNTISCCILLIYHFPDSLKLVTFLKEVSLSWPEEVCDPESRFQNFRPGIDFHRLTDGVVDPNRNFSSFLGLPTRIGVSTPDLTCGGWTSEVDRQQFCLISVLFWRRFDPRIDTSTVHIKRSVYMFAMVESIILLILADHVFPCSIHVYPLRSIQ